LVINKVPTLMESHDLFTGFCKKSLAPIGAPPEAFWREGAERASGRMERERKCGKRVKIASMQFLPMSFLAKTHKLCLLKNDAPSLALLVCERVKIAWI
ncbi:MAG: hypothetical protein IKQ23_06865, partial [Treponema sp.]|nr:hypothetical protein [Treponema sp.]